LSIATALVDPQVRPSGIFAQPSIVLYGFGASLVGFMSACASADDDTATLTSSSLSGRTCKILFAKVKGRSL
jgi:hypothetical protein